MIGSPNDGASEIRTVRGTTVRYTFGTEVLPDLLLDLNREARPGVVHRQHDAAHVELGVEVRLHQRDVAQQLPRPSSA